MRVKEKLCDKITPESLIDVRKITPELVRNAVCKLKSDKTDPLYSYTSDCLKNAPFILNDLLAKYFRSLVIHGNIGSWIMVSTIIPLIKDKL